MKKVIEKIKFGDSVHIESINKTGLVVLVPDGLLRNGYAVQFPDGTVKLFDSSNVELMVDDKEIERTLEMKESIFKDTIYEKDILVIQQMNPIDRFSGQIYDDASDIVESMKDLNPLEYVKWFMLVGYTEQQAINFLKRELCGEQSVYVIDIEDNTKSKFVSTGYSIGFTFIEDELGELDHWYYAVPEGEYKWEATFETYADAEKYIEKETRNANH
jgi:hypothetical protein